jgi:hypothetical protein
MGILEEQNKNQTKITKGGNTNHLPSPFIVLTWVSYGYIVS